MAAAASSSSSPHDLTPVKKRRGVGARDVDVAFIRATVQTLECSYSKSAVVPADPRVELAESPGDECFRCITTLAELCALPHPRSVENSLAALEEGLLAVLCPLQPATLSEAAVDRYAMLFWGLSCGIRERAPQLKIPAHKLASHLTGQPYATRLLQILDAHPARTAAVYALRALLNFGSAHLLTEFHAEVIQGLIGFLRRWDAERVDDRSREAAALAGTLLSQLYRLQTGARNGNRQRSVLSEFLDVLTKYPVHVPEFQRLVQDALSAIANGLDDEPTVHCSFQDARSLALLVERFPSPAVQKHVNRALARLFRQEALNAALTALRCCAASSSPRRGAADVSGDAASALEWLAVFSHATSVCVRLSEQSSLPVLLSYVVSLVQRLPDREAHTQITRLFGVCSRVYAALTPALQRPSWTQDTLDVLTLVLRTVHHRCLETTASGCAAPSAPTLCPATMPELLLGAANLAALLVPLSTSVCTASVAACSASPAFVDLFSELTSLCALEADKSVGEAFARLLLSLSGQALAKAAFSEPQLCQLLESAVRCGGWAQPAHGVSQIADCLLVCSRLLPLAPEAPRRGVLDLAYNGLQFFSLKSRVCLQACAALEAALCAGEHGASELVGVAGAAAERLCDALIRSALCHPKCRPLWCSTARILVALCTSDSVWQRWTQQLSQLKVTRGAWVVAVVALRILTETPTLRVRVVEQVVATDVVARVQVLHDLLSDGRGTRANDCSIPLETVFRETLLLVEQVLAAQYAAPGNTALSRLVDLAVQMIASTTSTPEGRPDVEEALSHCCCAVLAAAPNGDDAPHPAALDRLRVILPSLVALAQHIPLCATERAQLLLASSWNTFLQQAVFPNADALQLKDAVQTTFEYPLKRVDRAFVCAEPVVLTTVRTLKDGLLKAPLDDALIQYLVAELESLSHTADAHVVAAELTALKSALVPAEKDLEALAELLALAVHERQPPAALAALHQMSQALAAEVSDATVDTVARVLGDTVGWLMAHPLETHERALTAAVATCLVGLRKCSPNSAAFKRHSRAAHYLFVLKGLLEALHAEEQPSQPPPTLSPRELVTQFLPICRAEAAASPTFCVGGVSNHVLELLCRFLGRLEPTDIATDAELEQAALLCLSEWRWEILEASPAFKKMFTDKWEAVAAAHRYCLSHSAFLRALGVFFRRSGFHMALQAATRQRIVKWLDTVLARCDEACETQEDDAVRDSVQQEATRRLEEIAGFGRSVNRRRSTAASKHKNIALEDTTQVAMRMTHDRTSVRVSWEPAPLNAPENPCTLAAQPESRRPLLDVTTVAVAPPSAAGGETNRVGNVMSDAAVFAAMAKSALLSCSQKSRVELQLADPNVDQQLASLYSMLNPVVLQQETARSPSSRAKGPSPDASECYSRTTLAVAAARFIKDTVGRVAPKPLAAAPSVLLASSLLCGFSETLAHTIRSHRDDQLLVSAVADALEHVLDVRLHGVGGDSFTADCWDTMVVNVSQSLLALASGDGTPFLTDRPSLLPVTARYLEQGWAASPLAHDALTRLLSVCTQSPLSCTQSNRSGPVRLDETDRILTTNDSSTAMPVADVHHDDTVLTRHPPPSHVPHQYSDKHTDPLDTRGLLRTHTEGGTDSGACQLVQQEVLDGVAAVPAAERPERNRPLAEPLGSEAYPEHTPLGVRRRCTDTPTDCCPHLRLEPAAEGVRRVEPRTSSRLNGLLEQPRGAADHDASCMHALPSFLLDQELRAKPTSPTLPSTVAPFYRQHPLSNRCLTVDVALKDGPDSGLARCRQGTPEEVPTYPHARFETAPERQFKPQPATVDDARIAMPTFDNGGTALRPGPSNDTQSLRIPAVLAEQCDQAINSGQLHPASLRDGGKRSALVDMPVEQPTESTCTNAPSLLHDGQHACRPDSASRPLSAGRPRSTSLDFNRIEQHVVGAVTRAAVVKAWRSRSSAEDTATDPPFSAFQTGALGSADAASSTRTESPSAGLKSYQPTFSQSSPTVEQYLMLLPRETQCRIVGQCVHSLRSVLRSFLRGDVTTLKSPTNADDLNAICKAAMTETLETLVAFRSDDAGNLLKRMCAEYCSTARNVPPDGKNGAKIRSLSDLTGSIHHDIPTMVAPRMLPITLRDVWMLWKRTRASDQKTLNHDAVRHYIDFVFSRTNHVFKETSSGRESAEVLLVEDERRCGCRCLRLLHHDASWVSECVERRESGLLLTLWAHVLDHCPRSSSLTWILHTFLDGLLFVRKPQRWLFGRANSEEQHNRLRNTIIKSLLYAVHTSVYDAGDVPLLKLHLLLVEAVARHNATANAEGKTAPECFFNATVLMDILLWIWSMWERQRLHQLDLVAYAVRAMRAVYNAQWVPLLVQNNFFRRLVQVLRASCPPVATLYGCCGPPHGGSVDWGTAKDLFFLAGRLGCPPSAAELLEVVDAVKSILKILHVSLREADPPDTELLFLPHSDHLTPSNLVTAHEPCSLRRLFAMLVPPSPYISMRRCQMNGCLALALLSMLRDAAVAEFKRKKGIQLTLALLQDAVLCFTSASSSTAGRILALDIAQAAATLLCNTCYRRSDIQRCYGDLGACQTVIRVMTSSLLHLESHCDALRTAATRTLMATLKSVANLALDPRNVPLLIHSGITATCESVLDTVLRSFDASDSARALALRQVALRTLSNLVVEFTHAAMQSFQSAIPLLLEIVRRLNDTPDALVCVTLIFDILSALCRTPQNAARFHLLQGHTVVLRYLQHPSCPTDAYLSHFVLRLIERQGAQCPQSLLTMQKNGLFYHIVSLISSPSVRPSVVVRSFRVVLVALVSQPREQELLDATLDAGVHRVALRYLCGSSSSSDDTAAQPQSSDCAAVNFPLVTIVCCFLSTVLVLQQQHALARSSAPETPGSLLATHSAADPAPGDPAPAGGGSGIPCVAAEAALPRSPSESTGRTTPDNRWQRGLQFSPAELTRCGCALIAALLCVFKQDGLEENMAPPSTSFASNYGEPKKKFSFLLSSDKSSLWGDPYSLYCPSSFLSVIPKSDILVSGLGVIASLCRDTGGVHCARAFFSVDLVKLLRLTLVEVCSQRLIISDAADLCRLVCYCTVYLGLALQPDAWTLLCSDTGLLSALESASRWLDASAATTKTIRQQRSMSKTASLLLEAEHTTDSQPHLDTTIDLCLRVREALQQRSQAQLKADDRLSDLLSCIDPLFLTRGMTKVLPHGVQELPQELKDYLRRGSHVRLLLPGHKTRLLEDPSSTEEPLTTIDQENTPGSGDAWKVADVEWRSSMDLLRLEWRANKKWPFSTVRQLADIVCIQRGFSGNAFSSCVASTSRCQLPSSPSVCCSLIFGSPKRDAPKSELPLIFKSSTACLRFVSVLLHWRTAVASGFD